jgi:hypothetical protein
MVHYHMQSSKTVLNDRFDSQPHVRQLQRRNGRIHRSSVNARIQQSSQNHIATDPRGTFQPCNSHAAFRHSKRLNTAVSRSNPRLLAGLSVAAYTTECMVSVYDCCRFPNRTACRLRKSLATTFCKR